MSDLAEFLLARIAEDEQVARAIRDGEPWRHNPSKHWRKPGTAWFEEAVFTGPAGATAVCIAGTGESDHPEAMARADHIARWDPARVLAECEAKRQIVELHGRMGITPEHPQFNDSHLTTESMVICRSCEPERMFRRTRSWPCRTLRALAQPYADHPHFHPSWLLRAPQA